MTTSALASSLYRCMYGVNALSDGGGASASDDDDEDEGADMAMLGPNAVRCEEQEGKEGAAIGIVAWQFRSDASRREWRHKEAAKIRES